MVQNLFAGIKGLYTHHYCNVNTQGMGNKKLLFHILYHSKESWVKPLFCGNIGIGRVCSTTDNYPLTERQRY